MGATPQPNFTTVRHDSLKYWVRAVSALAFAMIALVIMLASPAPASTGRVFRVTPNGTLGADGSSWTKAGKLVDVPRFIRLAEPGDEIWIRGDAGTYYTNGPVVLDAGGVEGAPVIVRGVAFDGSTRVKPTFVGTRTAPYDPKGNPGTEVFKLLAGADNLEFRNLAFVNQGNGAFRVGADITNLTVHNMRATNVRRFFESLPSGTENSATITGLQISAVTVNGYSKGAIHLRSDTNNVLIRDVVGDSQRQDGDNFAIGVHLEDTVHDVLVQRVTMRNSHATIAGGYWNGDGFAAEDDTYDLQFVDTVATGSADAGYDLKSTSTTLLRAVAKDNNRNYRFWGQAEMIASVGLDPNHRGGTGGQAQAWAGNNAQVRIVDSTFTDQRSNTVVFVLDSKPQVTLQNVNVTKAPDAKETIVEPGARLFR